MRIRIHSPGLQTYRHSMEMIKKNLGKRPHAEMKALQLPWLNRFSGQAQTSDSTVLVSANRKTRHTSGRFISGSDLSNRIYDYTVYRIWFLDKDQECTGFRFCRIYGTADRISGYFLFIAIFSLKIHLSTLILLSVINKR